MVPSCCKEFEFETGPKLLRGDPAAARSGESPRVSNVGNQSYTPSLSLSLAVSDSSLKFTHVLYNLSPAELYELAIKYEKGSFITWTGALATLSRAKTGRAPRDKRVVKEKTSEDELWWGKGSPNIEMDEQTFLVNRERAVDYSNSLDKRMRLSTEAAGSDPNMRLSMYSQTN